MPENRNLTAGHSVEDKSMTPKVTVATVVRNASGIIADTIQSILSQDYRNVELIVVDGASSDDTLDQIMAFNSQIDLLISESDRGVYDGMNKALSKASGDYIIFMNAGDRFFAPSSIRDVFESEKFEPFDFITCAYEYRHEGYVEIITPMTPRERISLLESALIDRAMQRLACHQATFSKVTALRTLGGYDTRFKLLADQDVLLRSVDRGMSSGTIEKIVCTYSSGGMSSNAVLSSSEFTRLLKGRGYDASAVKNYFTPGLQRRLKEAVRPYIKHVPIFGNVFVDREALRRELVDLRAQVHTQEHVDPVALAKAGVGSFADLTVPEADADRLRDQMASMWSLKLEGTNSGDARATEVHFVTFADGGSTFANALARIGQEANEMGRFKSVELYSFETALAKWPHFSDTIDYCRTHRKGLGFWRWKPFIVYERLKELKDGEILFYCDAGSELSRYGRPVFDAMIESTHINDHLFFQMNQYPEHHWTKPEVLSYFSERYKNQVRNSGQIAATSFFLKRTPETLDLCRQWVDLSETNSGRLIDDAINGPSPHFFREHRYDQSLLSCLVKVNGLTNFADTSLCNTFHMPSDWKRDIHAIHLPIFWAHRKADTNAVSDVNYRIELMRIRAYNYLINCRYGSGDPIIWKSFREDIKSIFRELGLRV